MINFVMIVICLSQNTFYALDMVKIIIKHIQINLYLEFTRTIICKVTADSFLFISYPKLQILNIESQFTG